MIFILCNESRKNLIGKYHFRIKCDAKRCKLCEESFTAGEKDVASYRCADECEKCKLCDGPDAKDVPQCEKWCKKGPAVCRSACYKGIAVCGLCSLNGQCNLLYPYGKKK